MDPSPCPLDAEFSDQIAALLAPPSPDSAQEYFDDIIRRKQCHGIKIKQGEFGKDYYLNPRFQYNDDVTYDGAVLQGTLNVIRRLSRTLNDRIEAERQIESFRLKICIYSEMDLQYAVKTVSPGVYANVDFKEEELILKDQMLVASQHSSNKIDCLVCSYCFCFIGSVELQIGRKLYLQGLGLSAKQECDIEATSDDSEEDCTVEMMDHESTKNKGCVEPCAPSTTNGETVPEEILASLMNNNIVLPYSERFSLPPVVSCPGGCEEEHYCSKLCAEADWEAFHSLLCTGEKADSSRREALVKFIEHATRTNDIFILAAKVISSTILRYKKLKVARFGREPPVNGTDVSCFSLLLEAWKPVTMGFKKKWWDCVALPNDVDSGNEVSFRMQIRDLAYTSLEHLKEAIFDKECAPLFSLDIYGHIIGMFELNNLDLVVASPVEDYFIYIDDLPSALKNKAEKVTRPFLVALGDDYSVYCQGTAFFPLQSCINHSCWPNAKAFKRDEDKDGQATIIARRPIMNGEEITISYIDESLPYEERQSLLADYGFKCRCPRCLEEILLSGSCSYVADFS